MCAQELVRLDNVLHDRPATGCAMIQTDEMEGENNPLGRKKLKHQDFNQFVIGARPLQATTCSVSTSLIEYYPLELSTSAEINPDSKLLPSNLSISQVSIPTCWCNPVVTTSRASAWQAFLFSWQSMARASMMLGTCSKSGWFESTTLGKDVTYIVEHIRSRIPATVKLVWHDHS